MKLRIKLSDKIEELDVTRQGDQLLVTLADGCWMLKRCRQASGEMLIEAVNEETGERKWLRSAGIHQTNRKRQLWVNGQTISYERILDEQNAGTSADDLAGGVICLYSFCGN